MSKRQIVKFQIFDLSTTMRDERKITLKNNIKKVLGILGKLHNQSGSHTIPKAQ